jgi:UDP-glucose 4-epimerase
MHILITGGAGFIASHVADTYLEAGHQVSIIDNLSTGKLSYVNPRAQFFQADITDAKAMEQLILTLKPDVINHHAAHIQVGNSVKNPQFDATNNIIGLLNILQPATEVGVKQVIMASTGGAMYGNKPTPFVETYPAEPLSPYGVSKRAGELYLRYYYEQYQIPYISLRYANVYGPRQNPHGESGVIAIFSELLSQGKQATINGDGTNTRDYVNVKDVARANALALGKEFVGEINIGTSREISTNDVYSAVASAFGTTEPVNYGSARPGEQKTSALNYSLATDILNWQPEVSFEDGVSEVVNWYKIATLT